MNMNEIITQLENFSLEQQEIRQAAEGLQAAVYCFLDQIGNKTTWSRSELDELNEICLVERSLGALSKALGTKTE